MCKESKEVQDMSCRCLLAGSLRTLLAVDSPVQDNPRVQYAEPPLEVGYHKTLAHMSGDEFGFEVSLQSMLFHGQFFNGARKPMCVLLILSFSRDTLDTSLSAR